MYFALKLYLSPNAIGEDSLLLNGALAAAANGDLEEFKRYRRKFKKLGDLRGLDSAILYANDPKPTTTNACD